MSHLTGKTVAFLATNGFEDSELTSPWEEIASHGATVELISTKAGSITGKNGHEARVDVTTDQAVPSRYDGLVLPGGVVNSDTIRLDDNAVSFVKQIVEAGTPVGVICHGAWILADADVLRGRTITSFPTLKTDLRNAGATWVDDEVVTDNGLVSSRTPDDLPAFNDKVIEEIAEGAH